MFYHKDDVKSAEKIKQKLGSKPNTVINVNLIDYILHSVYNANAFDNKKPIYFFKNEERKELMTLEPEFMMSGKALARIFNQKYMTWEQVHIAMPSRGFYGGDRQHPEYYEYAELPMQVTGQAIRIGDILYKSGVQYGEVVLVAEDALVITRTGENVINKTQIVGFSNTTLLDALDLVFVQ